MSSSRVLARSASSVVRTDVCAFCHVRQLLPVARINTVRSPAKPTQPIVFRRGYAQKLDVKRLRAAVDQKARDGCYKTMKRQGALLLGPDKAEAIYNDFVAHKDKKEYGRLIKQFTTKYGVNYEDIAGLALATYIIPDLSDSAKRAMLPPSPHKTVAGLMLQGCAENEDPLAVKHIMTAVYLNNYTTMPGVSNIVLLFPSHEILKYKKSLQKHADNGDPEALSLVGLFLEQEKQPLKAKVLYEKALQHAWIFKHAPGARNPLQLPVMAPWNALGYLLRNSPDAAQRSQAKSAFEQGATKADDPLSYYELASFYDAKDVKWLKCMSKAAASSHRDAMAALALFYKDLSSNTAIVESDTTGKMQKALHWLMGWKQGGAARLAMEWFEAAGSAGHKGALLQLALWYEGLGRKAEAREVLKRIVVPEEGVSTEAWSGVSAAEDWSGVVRQAKMLLKGIRPA